MRISNVSALTFCILALSSTGASGQLPRLSFDLTLGPSIDANSGPYRREGLGAVLDLSVGASFGKPDSRRMVFVASHGTQGRLRTSGDGLSWPDGTCCVPYFPAFAVTSVLGGLETSGRTLRVLTGAIRASDSGISTLGVGVRVDAALPLIKPVVFVASLRGVYIPDFNDDHFLLGGLSVGIGIR
jgi:hypothetical protein